MKIIPNKKDEYLKDFLNCKFYIDTFDGFEYACKIISLITDRNEEDFKSYLRGKDFILNASIRYNKILVGGYYVQNMNVNKKENFILISSKDFYNRFLNKENWNKI